MNKRDFYAGTCQDTSRWFVCIYGIDNNIAEAFANADGTAEAHAREIAAALNIAQALHEQSEAAT